MRTGETGGEALQNRSHTVQRIRAREGPNVVRNGEFLVSGWLGARCCGRWGRMRGRARQELDFVESHDFEAKEFVFNPMG